jgi:hypothetical protein
MFYSPSTYLQAVGTIMKNLDQDSRCPDHLPNRSQLRYRLSQLAGLFHVNPTAAARVRDQVRSCGICGGQSSAGAGFLRVLPFPLPILIPPTASHSSSSIIRDNRPNSDRRTKWTLSHPTRRTKWTLSHPTRRTK